MVRPLKKAAINEFFHLNGPYLLILLAGFGYYARQYLANRSLWLDEAMLANNVVSHSLRFLLTQTLESEQAAPVGFLVSLKILGKLFGYQDFILRLVPIFFGLAVLPVAYLLQKKFKHPITQFLFIGCFAISPILIYYSSEVKQYSVDVFFTIYLLWVGFNYLRWKFGSLILLVNGFFGIIFSSPSIFVLAGIGITLAIQFYNRRELKPLYRLIVIGVVWCLQFALIYFIFTRGIVENGFLQTYWQNAFAELPLTLSGIIWYLESALGLAYLGFSAPGPVPVHVLSAWYSPGNWIIFACILSGAYGLFRKNREWFWINILIISLTLTASGLHLYPFRSRPLLFLIPVIYSFLCGFVDFLLLTRFRILRVIGGVGAVFFLSLLLIPALQQLQRPTDVSNIKGALEYITLRHKAGDQISMSAWSVPAYQFYRPVYPMDTMTLIETIPIQNDSEAFMRKLCTQKQLGRTWTMFTHRFSERIDFLARLSTLSPIIDQWESTGAGVYLFDFSDPALCQRFQNP